MLVQGYASLAEYIWFGLLKKILKLLLRSFHQFPRVIVTLFSSLREQTGEQPAWQMKQFLLILLFLRKTWRELLSEPAKHIMFIFFYEVNKVFTC